jgi:hypothetical protein
MNNLIFLNHRLLFDFDLRIKNSSLHTDYLSIYRFFPNPPGVEYFNPRNMTVDFNGPWKLEPTATPLPALPATPITFDEATDDFGSTICQELEQGRQVYLMWSGGIDSTAVAVSVLKHIKPACHSNLHVVLTDSSKHENPMFYHKFLSKFDQIDVLDFDPANINLSNSLILDGEGGDQAYGSSAANKIFSLHPEKILLPWRQNLDFLHNYWYKESMPEFWDWLLELMNKTIDHGPVAVETCFDFFWWLNFNCKLDSTLFRHTLRLSENVSDQDFEYFSKSVMRRLYASDKIQQWSMTAGAENKIGQAKKTVKWAGRKYIYDFDRNEYYFREKRKEFSTEVTAKLSTRHFAIDSQYRRYSFRDRETRQQIGKIFQLAG